LRYIARLEKAIDIADVKNEVAIVYAQTPFEIHPDVNTKEDKNA
jgi:hypothetical protein